jgi:orotate phosphoribosyltransferase
MVDINYFRLPREGKVKTALAIYHSKPSTEESRLGKLPGFFTSDNLKQPTIVLTKGKLSPYYVDLRVIPAFPDYFSTIVNQLIWYIDGVLGLENVQYVVSTESAGIPFGAAVAYKLHVPFNFARKEPKTHGTKKFVEGYIRSGSNGIDIDDLLTTTGSLQNAIEGARAEGGKILLAAVPLNRRQYDPQEIEKKLEVPILELLNIYEMVDIGEERNEISRNIARDIRRYHMNEAAYALSIIEREPDFIKTHPKRGLIVEAYEKMVADAKTETAKAEAQVVVDALKKL